LTPATQNNTKTATNLQHINFVPITVYLFTYFTLQKSSFVHTMLSQVALNLLKHSVIPTSIKGARCGAMVEALRYKPEGRRIYGVTGILH
jgi:hypothetical protein